MDHNDIRHKLSAYIDNAITSDEKAAIEAHLATCTECAEALAELRKTIEHIHAVEEVAPPAWMTSKIMAKVREEEERKKGIFRRLFFPLAVKVPLQAVVVLFLAVTAFYIYQGMHPAEKYAEAPVQGVAKKEAPALPQPPAKEKTPATAETRAKQFEQKPGYRSLDMKDEYERPAPPVPAPQTETSVPASKALSEPRAMMARPAAPPVMAEQAAGAAPSTERKRAAAAESLTARKGLSQVTEEDREAEERLTLTEHFLNHDLQPTMKIKGLQFVTRKVPDDLSGLDWLREMKAYRSIPCAKRYIVDVELPGRSLKYLYCYDRARIKLLGVFELISSVWMEQK